MICDADTVGVFQIESRAQMSMLPRLRPRNFYDLVIEVAIVRPGPIQGNMVHPYLRRRNGEEEVQFPSEALRQVLQKTLGVPLFQEQAMRVAMVGAGFSGAEADQLRRAMAAWKKSTRLLHFHDRIINGMLNNGYTRAFAEQCFEQIKGFGEYGFPESHSASFALLVYASAWLKRHHPAAFAAALINSQPMGFYQPAQIIRDAREHGVEVRGVDVNFSDWDCTLEESLQQAAGGGQQGAKQSKPSHKSTWGLNGPAIRLGLRMIKGLRQAHADHIAGLRARVTRFDSVEQFHQSTRLKKAVLRRLAEADAFSSLNFTRREALWEVMKVSDVECPLYQESTEALRHPGTEREEERAVQMPPLRACVPPCLRACPPYLPPLPLGQQVLTDYATIGLSLRKHPVALVRATLAAQRVITAAEMNALPHGKRARVAGLVLIRQRPGTASGIVFITLEDETGVANLIVRPNVFDRYRPAARHAGLLLCEGTVERQGQVVHLMARRLFDRSELIQGIEFASRDFH
jgi:error-prone DNA polymerase